MSRHSWLFWRREEETSEAFWRRVDDDDDDDDDDDESETALCCLSLTVTTRLVSRLQLLLIDVTDTCLRLIHRRTSLGHASAPVRCTYNRPHSLRSAVY